ncbi:unnamed protein product [Angiostrongylus costaricensis]|uniref:Uncharacterized protein n=1 Tax=Angiostrongylus costaricensis TaxID=334426 RepID=A0A0R3PJW6_ANGCS|nr:unnamed protein product [Angiostrongylus costaricensis]
MRSSSRNYYEGKNIERSRNRNTPKDKPSDSGRDSGKESSNISEHERKPACYVCEPTGWTVPDSEITDPVYVCESDSSTFVPLPQAQIDKRPTTDPRIEEHFIGVRTCDEAGAIVKPDDFVLYYRKDDDNELDVTIPLCLAHRNTRNKESSAIIRMREWSGEHKSELKPVKLRLLSKCTTSLLVKNSDHLAGGLLAVRLTLRGIQPLTALVHRL